jgi:prepilin-type N-terminal cleavage/methylation domain-containing protein
MDKKAFTLTELLISIAVLSVIVALSVPFSISQVPSEKANKVANDIKLQLELSQEYAKGRKLDKAYGVTFSASKFSVFNASSCAGAKTSFDVPLEPGIGLTNTITNSEVCFELGTYLPNNTGSISVSGQGSSYRVDINSEGAVNVIKL